MKIPKIIRIVVIAAIAVLVVWKLVTMPSILPSQK